MKKIIFLVLSIFALTHSDSYAQLGMSVDQLADRMYNSDLNAIYQTDLFNRNYKGVCDLAYSNIYQNQSGTIAPVSYFYMGACLELGMGTSEVSQYKAKAHYEKGAQLGSIECRNRLAQINQSGWWGATQENREAFARAYGRPGTSGGYGNSGYGNSGSSSSSKHKCSSCNGTGKCEFCGGDGWHRNSSDGKLYPCNSCNKTGKCQKCKGRGTL